jgi:hypothetical protein
MSALRPDENLLIESRELTLLSADRATGLPHQVQLPFIYEDGIVYLLARGRDDVDWYRNLERDRGVVLRVGRRSFRGRASLFSGAENQRAARRIMSQLAQKYGSIGAQGEAFPVQVQVQF